LKVLPQKPEILWMTPQSLEEIFENLRDLGRATERDSEAETLIATASRRLEALEQTTSQLATRPRVFCMEWIDPVYASGHWVPQMVHIAGGTDALGHSKSDSTPVTWEQLINYAPEVLVIMPCGFNLRQTMEQVWKSFRMWQSANRHSEFFELPAVRNGRVYGVDANSYFARPGPRVVEGAELLAHLIHPEAVAWHGPANAFQPIDVALLFGSLTEGSDYYIENGAWVFTASYLKKRGYCCNSGCRHCPY